MSFKNRLTMSTEAIAFQDSQAADYLTSCFEKMMATEPIKTDYGRRYDIQYWVDIVGYVKERFGIKLNIDENSEGRVVGWLNPVYNGKHVFFSDIYRPQAELDVLENIRNIKNFKKKSYVDLKSAKVAGFFSDIENQISFDVYNLQNTAKLSAREIAAVFAHELGHIFTTLEFFDRSYTANQTLACAIKAANASKDKTKDEHIYILQQLGDATGQEGLVELADIKDGYTKSMVALGLGFKESGSLSNLNYDETQVEAQADVFATRLGFGKELVTASYKLEKLNMGFLDKYRPVKWVLEFSKIAVAPLLVSYFAMMPMAAVGWIAPTLANLGLASAASYVSAMLLTYVSGDAVRDWSRDDPKVRYLRIKEQLNTLLKNKNLSDNQKKETLMDIEQIDEVIKNTKDTINFSRAIANFVMPSNRAAKKGIELQRQLESLISNDVYARAALLSTLKV